MYVASLDIFQSGNNKGTDRTALMHSLICVLVVRMQQDQDFSLLAFGPSVFMVLGLV